MKHIFNKSDKYRYAKKGILHDGIYSIKDTEDCICGLILFFLKNMKEEKIFPQINILKVQKQKDYQIILKNIKNKYFQKINFNEKKIFLGIFMLLEFNHKSLIKKEKI